MRAFGPDHLAALAATALAAWAMVRWPGRRAGTVLGGLLAAALMLDPCLNDPPISVPLELCDLAAFACIFALWAPGRKVFEFAYFWGLSGTLQALLTPDLAAGFPDPDYFRFFVLHGGIVAAVLHLGPGTGLRPRAGAVWRVYGWTVVYAAAIGLVDWVFQVNYFYLRSKPEGSILDPFGPWPWYLPAAAAIGAVLFWLLDLPYRVRRSKIVRNTSG